ncbi:hypothetical protein [Burkholderia cenocepacia]|uniref:hypothetical protein n=1 Tax=Burkholderia cenocepacia TaxID=95486 RepID=UPI000760D49A|nr:hypothetical protein [Burkholderia cenocepacia]KWU19049.1 hypothetical protein AS149_12440 [Burkholderia cenocepacia]
MLQNLELKDKATLLGRLFERHNVTLPRKMQLEYVAMLEGARNWPHLVAELQQPTTPPAAGEQAPLVLFSPSAPAMHAVPSIPDIAAVQAEDVDPAKRYLVCDGWAHCFVGSKESVLRFVIDLSTRQFVRCDALVRSKWEACDPSEKKDVMESLHDNDVFETVEDWAMTLTDAVPEWTADY